MNIDRIVNRFLSWSLPKDFCPDCGISFDGRKDDQWNKNKTWPIGTNLFSKDQAKAMFEYALAEEREALLSRAATTQAGDPERYFMDHGMIHDRQTGRHISTDESTHPGFTAELFGRLRSYERMVHDYPKLSEFFSKYALGSKPAPSCFGCGAEWSTWDGTTRHLELPDIFLCAKCAEAVKAAPSQPVAPVVADGWQLVPKEITVEMDIAVTGPGNNPLKSAFVDYHMGTVEVKRIWKQMLAAAPKPPHPAQPQVSLCAPTGQPARAWTDAEREDAARVVREAAEPEQAQEPTAADWRDAIFAAWPQSVPITRELDWIENRAREIAQERKA